MKRNLLSTILLTALLGAITIPLTSRAQCTCDGGVAPNVTKHIFVLDTTNAPSSAITFPKFDPSTGTLNCVRFNDTLSLISTSEVTNTASVQVTYRFLLNVTNDFSGDGISVNESANRNYGPTVLQKYGDLGDRTVYGPDTLFKNSFHQSNTSNVTPYFGTGNVSINYTVNGGLISTQGGINYTYQIISRYWGRFGLTYYWCPLAVLNTNIKNFAAVKSNKKVNLSWIVGNDINTNTYEIQISKNSREFFAVGTSKANTASSGATAKYTYQHDVDQAAAGQLYFRIKQTDANGKVSFTAVKAVNMDSESAASVTVYPNPAVNRISLQFDGNLNGDYKVDVTNQVGQTVISRPLKLKNTSLVDLHLNKITAPGMYYVRVKENATGQVFTSKVMINR